jgi:hypothetical protein
MAAYGFKMLAMLIAIAKQELSNEPSGPGPATRTDPALPRHWVVDMPVPTLKFI